MKKIKITDIKIPILGWDIMLANDECPYLGRKHGCCHTLRHIAGAGEGCEWRKCPIALSLIHNAKPAHET